MPDPDYAERERERKQFYHLRTKAMSGAKPPVKCELLIDDIDWSPCHAVRECLNAEVVAEYAETEAEWSDAKPAAVWSGGGKYFAGDAGHRKAAKLKNGKKKILCSVVQCESAEAAEMLAWAFALGPANAEHKALRRSDEDKRATVRAALLRPEYANASDRKLAEVCRVVHGTVSRLRRTLTEAGQLSGEAASDSEDRAKVSGERKGKGGRAAIPTAPDAEPTDGTDPDDSPPAAGAGDPAARPRQSYAMTDAKGREIPESLAAAFVAGRSLVRNAKEMLNEIHEALAAAGDEEWGPGVKAVLPNIEGDFKRVGEDLFGSVPYVLCPHLGPDGTHLYGGVCKFCLDGRGWFTKNNYLQLSDEKRKLFEPESKPQSKPEAA